MALLLQLEQLVSDMSSIYSKAKICDYKNPNKCDLSLEPGTVRHKHEMLARYSKKQKMVVIWALLRTDLYVYNYYTQSVTAERWIQNDTNIQITLTYKWH